jgi:MFS family permease
MGSLNVMPEYTSYFTLTTVTKSLNTAVSYSGGAVCAPFAGLIVDWRGRRESIFWSCFVTLVGAVIQSAAQNIGMFIAGRFIIGLGLGLAATATPTYVAEACPPKHRGFALGLYYACWGVGTLIASGVCYGVRLKRPSPLMTDADILTEPTCSQHLGMAYTKYHSSRPIPCVHVCYCLYSRVSKMAY